MNYERSKLEGLKLLLEIIALSFGIILGITGSIIGMIAWSESREANRLNIDSKQGAEDTKFYELLLADPALSGLFVDFRGETNTMSVARKKILLLISTNNDEFLMLCGEQTDPVPWQTVQDLNDYVWAGAGFYDERRVRLRKAYNLMEWVSAQAEYDFEANRRVPMTKGDILSWVSYIDLLASHPLFLASLQDQHDHNSTSKEYCAFVRERILSQAGGRELLMNVYSNMLDPAWADAIGDTMPH